MTAGVSFYSANNGVTQTYVLSGNGTSLIVELWGEGAFGGDTATGLNGGFTNASGGPIVGTLSAGGGKGGAHRTSGASAGGAGGTAPTGGDVNTAGNAGGAGNGSSAGGGGDGPNGNSISGVNSGGPGNNDFSGTGGTGFAPGGGYGGSSVHSGCIDLYSGGGGSGAYLKKTYSSGLGAATITMTFSALAATTGAACFTISTASPPPNVAGTGIVNTLL